MASITVATGGEAREFLPGLAARDAFLEANLSRWDVRTVVLGHGAYAVVSEGGSRMIVARGKDEGIRRLLADGAQAIGQIGFALVSFDAVDAEDVMEREFSWCRVATGSGCRRERNHPPSTGKIAAGLSRLRLRGRFVSC